MHPYPSKFGVNIGKKRKNSFMKRILDMFTVQWGGAWKGEMYNNKIKLTYSHKTKAYKNKKK